MLVAVIAALLLQQTPAEREIERLAMDGWRAARAVAPKGGALELLGPVNARLKDLDAFPHTAARYAEIAIRAAVAAAQEEREEMMVLLAHARDLSKQMALAGAAPRWPLPIDEIEGELWFEVDQFAEARDAFERATQASPTPNAWVGLARAADKLGDAVTACRAYTSAQATPGLPPSVDLEIAVYLLKCSA
ncbi:MAG TPA: hypothetical protein VEC39_05990 [Vicinamibacterales bacterium]|nr:hypothetical protein [Vicinamibacterales bacterium]